MTLTQWGLVVEPAELAAELGNDELLIVDLSRQETYRQLHLPGAIFVASSELISGVKPATGKLPSAERLNALFSRVGLASDKHVVVYDDEGGGWAGRFIWTLDVIGHRRYSYLNGGIHAWLKERLPVQQETNEPIAAPYTVEIDTGPIADLDYIMSRLGDDDLAVWDARSPEEYRGEKVFAHRGGHIPGAVNLDWLELMDVDNGYRIRGDATQLLEAKGITAEKEVITHCQTHHRSGFTYLVARHLGFERVKGYDGSWSEWGNREDTPVE